MSLDVGDILVRVAGRVFGPCQNGAEGLLLEHALGEEEQVVDDGRNVEVHVGRQRGVDDGGKRAEVPRLHEVREADGEDLPPHD